MRHVVTFVVLSVVVGFFGSASFAQDLQWGAQIGGTNEDLARGVALAADGSVVSVGQFLNDPVDFDPGPGVVIVAPNFWDGFVTSLDSNGNFQWVTRIGESGEQVADKIAFDPSGNIVVAGWHGGGTLGVEPDTGGGCVAPGFGGWDGFVVKLDAGGDCVWAFVLGDTGYDHVRALDVDPSGNVYVGGFFSSTVDFDPGAGTAPLTALAGTDPFVAKYDPSGALVWAIGIEGDGSDDESRAIALDAAGNIYVGGVFSGTSDFDPGPGVSTLTSNGSRDVFVAKYDASANLVWARQIGGSQFEEYFAGLETGPSGDVYVSGYFNGTVSLSPAPGVADLVSNGGRDAFVARLDSAGTFLWAHGFGGVDDEYAFSLTVDGQEFVHVVGEFRATVDFDPGAGVFDLTAVGADRDGFVSILDDDGDFVWAGQIGGPGSIALYDVALDAAGNIHAAGKFTTNIDFDPGPGTDPATSFGNYDALVVKLSGRVAVPMSSPLAIAALAALLGVGLVFGLTRRRRMVSKGL